MPENTAESPDYKSRYPDSVAPDAMIGVRFLTNIIRGPVKIIGMPITKGRQVRSRTFDTTDADLEPMRAYIASFEAMEGYNVFYAANRAAPGAGSVPDRSEIERIDLINIDLDPTKGVPLEVERDRIRARVHQEIVGPVQPRAVEDTGGGAQIVYELAEPLVITQGNRTTVIAMVEALMRDLARSLGADTATCRVEALFRVPGTRNWPTPAKVRDGRKPAVSGIWFHGGPRTTLDELRSRTLSESGPDDTKPAGGPDIDLGEVGEHDVIEVLEAPDRLPAHIRTLIATKPALAAAVRKPADETNTSARDYDLCMTMVSLRIPPGDMALILAAYGHKVRKAHYDEHRLFSYIRTTIANALADDPLRLLGDEGFDEEKAAETRAKTEGKFRPVWLDELLASAVMFEDILVGGLMNRQAVTVIYGESGAGKTFVALDLAYRISLGMDWCGRKTTKCVVVYVAAESPRSVRYRLKALADTYGVSENFCVIQAAPDMSDPKSADLQAMGKQIAALKVDVGLIVIDTLARTMTGNENSTQDMGALVRNGDFLRDGFHANVCWVHHSGKDRSLGARGSSSLRAATDVEIEIHDNWFDVTKSRDEGAFRHKFSLKTGIEVGKRPDGSPITTCIVQWADNPSAKTGGSNAEMTRRDAVLSIMRRHGRPMTVADIHAAADLWGIKLGLSKATEMMLRREVEDSTRNIFCLVAEKPARTYGLCNP